MPPVACLILLALSRECCVCTALHIFTTTSGARPLNFIVPGCNILILKAGLAGLGIAAQLQRRLNEYDYEIHEKLDDVGGTWAQNTYPNLSCDVPSEVYSYSFFQNPVWTHKVAAQSEILANIQSFVRRLDLESRVHLQQECTSLRWSDKDRL